jgi:light-regulated signal transduction histidine kinase (bacteriophytochrome)
MPRSAVPLLLYLSDPYAEPWGPWRLLRPGPPLQCAGTRLEVEVGATPTVSFPEKNLLSNALKYCGPARALRVGLHSRVEDAWVLLEVADQNLGIDAASKHRLFGLFQRLHTHVEDSGTGLYMVKRMIENAGGCIEVHS